MINYAADIEIDDDDDQPKSLSSDWLMWLSE